MQRYFVRLAIVATTFLVIPAKSYAEDAAEYVTRESRGSTKATTTRPLPNATRPCRAISNLPTPTKFVAAPA